MSTVLYITSNPKSEKDSYSLKVGREFLNAYKIKNPGDNIFEIDTFKAGVPLIDKDVLKGWSRMASGTSFGVLTTDEQQKIKKIDKFTDQFIAADKYIFVTPMWNFTVPAMMKAYIDTICIVNRTFKYTQNGAEGLLKGKKAVHIQASGGVYSEGPAKDFEMGNRYIKSICMFLGITFDGSIFIEGIQADPNKANEILQGATDLAVKTAETF
ncbi:MAG: FMN-dependent NADH-azoreductase [Clostridiaceae bacterium]|nr:FMN-dependent NADH-azoreductase [Clostridiaceae bacterium]